MNISGFVKLIKPKHLWSLFKLSIRNPLFVIPTFLATKKCIQLSNEHFGNLHHQNTPANAFRHAIWNYLIAKKCFWWRKKEDSVISWAKKITDWHEDFSPNHELAKEMDYHNNALGRVVFLQYGSKSIAEIASLLKNMTSDSVKVTKVSEIRSTINRMVHIV